MQLIEEDKETKQKLFEISEKTVEAERAKEEMRESMDRAISEKISYKIQLDEKRDKVEILTEENGSLRSKVQMIDEEAKKGRKQLKALQKEVETNQSMQVELVAVKNDLQFTQT